MTRIERRLTCPKCRAVFRRTLRRCPLDGSALDPLPQDPLVGATIGGRYTIEYVLSDGASARKYASTDERTGEQCMVKVMYGDYASVERHRRRFAREVEVGSRLCHPNVLAVIDAAETESGLPFLVTVHVIGEALSSVIANSAPLGKLRAIRLLTDIAGGLSHIHERGFVHRGLTSDAIVVTHFRDSEAAIISDLGIACDTGDRESHSMGRLTRVGKVVGTPAYMSPEQSTDRALDHRSDLYSLGVLLYEMLSGRSPFEGSAIELASKNFATPPPPICERVSGLRVDPTLESIANQLMEKDPNSRFQSAHDLLAALDTPTLLSL